MKKMVKTVPIQPRPNRQAIRQRPHEWHCFVRGAVRLPALCEGERLVWRGGRFERG